MTSPSVFPTLDALRGQLVSTGTRDPAYVQKMFQAVPDMPIVTDRGKYLMEKATGRVVLDIGCTGPISAAIRQVAKTYHGIDRTAGGDWLVVDLDHCPDEIPVYPGVDCIIASELLEHLANPGVFLARLREKYPGVETWITVPQAGAYQVHAGTHEIVSGDHVAWYSYSTLKTLLGRYGYTIQHARWYNGQPHKAEGLIVMVT